MLFCIRRFFMNRHHSIRILFVLGALLLLYPLTASAKYLIEFADGQRMTVSNYEQAGDTVKVHTSLGSFAFRKDDVVHITDLNPGEKKKPVTKRSSVRYNRKKKVRRLPCLRRRNRRANQTRFPAPNQKKCKTSCRKWKTVCSACDMCSR